MKRTIALFLCTALVVSVVVAGMAKKPDKPPGKPGKQGSSPGILTFTDGSDYLWGSDGQGPYVDGQEDVVMIVNGVFGGIQFDTRYCDRNIWLGFKDWTDVDGDGVMDSDLNGDGVHDDGEPGAWFTEGWRPMVDWNEDRDERPEWLPSGFYDFDKLQLFPDSVLAPGKGKSPRKRGTMEDMEIGSTSHCRFGCYNHYTDGSYANWMSHYGEDWFHIEGDLTMTRVSEDTWLISNTGYIDVYYDSTEHAVFMPFEFIIQGKS